MTNEHKCGAMEAAASILEEHSWARDIDWWMKATKKEVSLETVRECIAALRAAAQASPCGCGELRKALEKIAGNGNATGCNPQVMCDIANAALSASPLPVQGVPDDLRRAAKVLISNLWIDFVETRPPYEENWKEFDRLFPGVKWVHEALSAPSAAPKGE